MKVRRVLGGEGWKRRSRWRVVFVRVFRGEETVRRVNISETRGGRGGGWSGGWSDELKYCSTPTNCRSVSPERVR